MYVVLCFTYTTLNKYFVSVSVSVNVEGIYYIYYVRNSVSQCSLGYSDIILFCVSHNHRLLYKNNLFEYISIVGCM